MNARRLAWQLVCKALFRRGETARRELISLLGSADRAWPQVVSLGGAQLVTPALWLAFRSQTLSNALPQDARQYLKAVYEMNVERNAAMIGQLDEAIAALNRCGLRPMLLKGSAYLKLGTHGDLGARVTSDLDLLVPAESITVVSSLLEQMDYRPADVRLRPSHHHAVPLIRDGSPAAIELHSDVMPRWGRQLVPTQSMWQTRVDLEEGRFSVPSGTFAVLHRFAHDQIVDRHVDLFLISLRALQDLKALETYYGAGIDWTWLADHVARSGHGTAFKHYVYAGKRLAGVNVPESLRFSPRQALHFSICSAAQGSLTLARTAAVLDSFSVRRIWRKYGTQWTQ